ncbi:MAG TPA: hypothetical protein VKW08_26920 [Xanthobacteraceae bacterium]|jgi:hypothetical protein|nr:hypothetical protein [Xanthobacteraceae bacterium]
MRGILFGAFALQVFHCGSAFAACSGNIGCAIESAVPDEGSAKELDEPHKRIDHPEIVDPGVGPNIGIHPVAPGGIVQSGDYKPPKLPNISK